MNVKKGFIILAVLAGLTGSAYWMTGCQSSTQNQQTQPGQTATLTGSLQQGSISVMSLASYGRTVQPSSTPLVNYKLYCVTFENVPSAATGTADNSGTFSLKIKSYTPFGCFVLDTNNQHVADLLFAGLGTTAGAYSGSIMLTNNANVGTITVDPSTGMAVVNVKGVGGVSGNNITGTAFDPTGLWNFTCTLPAGDPVYSCPTDVPPSIYLHRISGIYSSDNQRHYGMGVWMSQSTYTACGSVEGLCSTPTCTTAQGPNGQTVALDYTDGTFTFAYDSSWQKVLSSYALNTFSTCGSTVTTCGQITANTSGWSYSDPTTGKWTAYSSGQCQQMCYADAFSSINKTPSLCIEDRNYKWDTAGMQNVPSTALTNDTSTSFIDFGNHDPVARLMFGELIYSSDTTASEVSTDYRLETLWDQSSGKTYVCYINEITKLSLSEIDAHTLVGTVDQTRTLSGGSQTQCTDPTIPNNYVNQDLSNPMHMMFKMTR